MSEYPVLSHPVIHLLLHVDLYRLPTVPPTDLIVAEIISAAGNPHTATFIEWAEKLPAHVRALATSSFTFKHGRTSSERVITLKIPMTQ